MENHYTCSVFVLIKYNAQPVVWQKPGWVRSISGSCSTPFTRNLNRYTAEWASETFTVLSRPWEQTLWANCCMYSLTSAIYKLYKILMYSLSHWGSFTSLDNSLFPVFCFKSSHIKLSFASCIVHVANFPEHSSLLPSLVMDSTYRPHATCRIKHSIGTKLWSIKFSRQN